MSRLIDADALLKKTINNPLHAPYIVEKDIRGMPTIQPEPPWIPVERELPEDRKSVIVCYRFWLQFSQKFAYAIVIGWHASKFRVKAEVFTDWDGGDFDYNEEQDENYIPEGWYEFTTQGNGDLMDWYIDAEVIAWMPLPEAYKPNK